MDPQSLIHRPEGCPRQSRSSLTHYAAPDEGSRFYGEDRLLRGWLAVPATPPAATIEMSLPVWVKVTFVPAGHSDVTC